MGRTRKLDRTYESGDAMANVLPARAKTVSTMKSRRVTHGENNR